MSAAVQKTSRLGLDVEDEPVGGRDMGEVAAGRVQDALGLRRRAAGVHDVERLLGVEGLGLVRLGLARSTRSCHQTSRPSSHATSWPVRRTTSTWRTSGHSRTASSTAGLSAAGARRAGSRRRR